MSTEQRDSGVYGDVDEVTYHADRRSLSASGAKLLLPPSVPAKFRERMDNPPEPKPAFTFGHLTHALVLGKGPRFAVLDPLVHGLKKDGTPAESPRATKMWQEAEDDARAAGLIPVHVDQFTKAQAMADVVHEHSLAGPYFLDPNGKAEVSLYADDPGSGVQLRGRTDWMTTTPDGRLLIVDYKTADDASREKFPRVAFDNGYYIQFAWYTALAVLCGLSDDPAFVFVVQEKSSPYLVNVIELDSEALDLGRRHMRQAIGTYAECMESGEWPGYEERIQTVSLPLYAFPDEEIVI